MRALTSDSAPSPFKALLVELVEAGMEVSREMMVGVRKATDHDQRIAYAAAHDRAARSVRLSIALHERLERRVNPKLDLKKAQVRDAVRRSIAQGARRATSPATTLSPSPPKPPDPRPGGTPPP